MKDTKKQSDEGRRKGFFSRLLDRMDNKLEQKSKSRRCCCADDKKCSKD